MSIVSEGDLENERSARFAPHTFHIAVKRNANVVTTPEYGPEGIDLVVHVFSPRLPTSGG